MTTCSYCSAKNKSDDLECRKCGAPLDITPEPVGNGIPDLFRGEPISGEKAFEYITTIGNANREFVLPYEFGQFEEKAGRQGDDLESRIARLQERCERLMAQSIQQEYELSKVRL